METNKKIVSDSCFSIGDRIEVVSGKYIGTQGDLKIIHVKDTQYEVCLDNLGYRRFGKDEIKKLSYWSNSSYYSSITKETLQESMTRTKIFFSSKKIKFNKE